MAQEQWYTIKVRLGFAPIVAWRLRKLNLDVRIPLLLIDRDPRLRELASTCYLSCRFAVENRRTIMTIPGVVDVLCATECDDDIADVI